MREEPVYSTSTPSVSPSAVDAEGDVTEPVPSLFDHFGGHYSVLHRGVEVARFAPSDHWSEFVAANQHYTFVWVARPKPAPAPRPARVVDVNLNIPPDYREELIDVLSTGGEGGLGLPVTIRLLPQHIRLITENPDGSTDTIPVAPRRFVG